MNNEKNPANNSSPANSATNQNEKHNEEQPLPFLNPLNPDDKKQITPEDLENEQKYKEALSERD